MRRRPSCRKLSQKKTGQDLFKVSDNLLTNLEEMSHSTKQLPIQGKDFNLLSTYYNKKSGGGNFIEKISRLNKKFYNASDKYIKSKKVLEKLNDDLFLNLFQQIDCYVEEIERLNKKISTNNNQELKNKIDELNKDISEKKGKIRNYEVKLREKTTNEEKLMKEIESYKRRIIFYKDKIKIGLLASNRNNTIQIPMETYHRVDNRKRTSKVQDNYETPTIKKTKSFHMKNRFHKDMGLKIDTEPNNIKENNKNNTNNDIEEKFTKININNLKLRESLYYKTDIDNHYLTNRVYDVYGKDIDEKEKSYQNNDTDDYFSKSYVTKTNQNNTAIKLTEEKSQNNSTIIGMLSKELYGIPENIRNKNDNNDYNKNIEFSESESNEDEKEKKSKTTNKRDTKGRSMTNKTKNPNQQINNANKIGGIKSKFLVTNKNTNIKSNIELKSESANNSIKREKQQSNIKEKFKNKKSKSKEKSSNLTEIHTPYNKRKNIIKYEKEKEKLIPKSKNQSSALSSANLRLNTTTASLSKKEKTVKKFDISKINNKLISNEKSNYTKITQKNIKGNNSMSNLKVVSLKSDLNKKFYGKDNIGLLTVLKDVNDDYTKSIEMLRSQEEQIKNMLRFIDLEEK